MDIRFPEFPAPRDPNPESVSRHRDHADSEFADFLDTSLKDQQPEKPRDDKVRDAAPRQTPVVRDEREEAPARFDAVDEKPDHSHDQPIETAAAAQPAPQPAEQVEKVIAPDAAAPSGNELAGTTEADAGQTAAGMAQPGAAPAAQPAGVAPPIAPAQAPSQAAAPAPGTSPANAAAPSPVAPGPVNEPPAAAAPQPATPTKEQTSFASELPAATAKAPEPAAASAKPSANAKAQSAASASGTAASTPAPQTVAAAPVATVDAASGENGREPGNAGAGSFTPPQAPPTQSASSAGPTAGDGSEESELAALLRPALTAANASGRAAAPETAPAPTNPAELVTQEPDLALAPSATAPEPVKSDGPSRPFGNVAPGLTLAAQITAQQTPEQANAAERLAQLAAAKQPEAAGASNVAASEVATAVDTPAATARVEQAPQLDLTTPRNMTVDVASAAAAARNARPTFHPLVAQVAAHVTQAAIDGNDRISIRLSPAELGRIDVRLDFGPEGRVQAVFAADRPQTVELLQRDARDLERALQDAGLRADSGSLSFNLRGEGHNGAQTSAETADNGRRDEAVAEIAVPQVQAYAAGSAAPSRLDIRI